MIISRCVIKCKVWSSIRSPTQIPWLALTIGNKTTQFVLLFSLRKAVRSSEKRRFLLLPPSDTRSGWFERVSLNSKKSRCNRKRWYQPHDCLIISSSSSSRLNNTLEQTSDDYQCARLSDHRCSVECYLTGAS